MPIGGYSRKGVIPWRPPNDILHEITEPVDSEPIGHGEKFYTAEDG